MTSWTTPWRRSRHPRSRRRQAAHRRRFPWPRTQDDGQDPHAPAGALQSNVRRRAGIVRKRTGVFGIQPLLPHPHRHRRAQFHPLGVQIHAHPRGVDIIQPDVSHAGGILETRKIAAMAEAFDVSVALHCPLGPIALASCLQVDFTTPNAFIQTLDRVLLDTTC